MIAFWLYVLLFLNNFIKIKSESLNKIVTVGDPKKFTQGEYLLKTIKENERKCEPNTFVFIECNVCHCGLDGKVHKTLCTKYKCNNDEVKTRRLGNIFGRCEPKHWYQISKCRLCYCVNKNKLICNINNSSDRVQLGPYKLYNCGENLLNNLHRIVASEEAAILRSVTKKVGHSKIKSSDLKTKTTITSTSKDKSTPMVILLNSEESIDSSKSKEDKALINMNIEITYRNINDEDNGSIDTAPKNNFFLKNIFNNYEDDGLNIGSLEYNEALDNKKSEVIQSRLNTDSDTHVSKEININDLHSVDLSKFLKNILNLAMRKSMVSVSSGKKCKPGASVKDGCNSCFCLTNGKTLCTDKDCE